MLEANLEGKVVAVTGAAGRLGQRVARRFAEYGATVAAIVLNEEEAGQLSFPEDAEGWAFPADVTQEAEVRACFQAIGQHLGRLDVLVHTVGGWGSAPLLDTSLDDWNGLVRLNLTSAFLCFREAARQMQGQGGRLIGIASAQGADRGRAQQAAYSVSKAGVVRLVESVAAEMGEMGITAHAIAPSTLLFDDESEQEGVPAGDVADLCLYLCTRTGASLNGAVLRAYGRTS